jgi:hypothetical protein
MSNTKQQAKREEWKSLIATQAKSGLTQKVFCAQNNLSFAKFGYYCKILKTQSSDCKSIATFAPIKISQHPIESEVRLNLPNGFQCIFSSATDIAQIKKLIEVCLSC